MAEPDERQLLDCIIASGLRDEVKWEILQLLGPAKNKLAGLERPLRDLHTFGLVIWPGHPFFVEWNRFCADELDDAGAPLVMILVRRRLAAGRMKADAHEVSIVDRRPTDEEDERLVRAWRAAVDQCLTACMMVVLDALAGPCLALAHPAAYRMFGHRSVERFERSWRPIDQRTRAWLLWCAVWAHYRHHGPQGLAAALDFGRVS